MAATVFLATVLRFAAYFTNERVWTWVFDAMRLDVADRLPGALRFFAYDSVKVLLLLVGMIFLIGLLRTAIRPETVRTYLKSKPLPVALALAALLGAVTPFCSCSSFPSHEPRSNSSPSTPPSRRSSPAAGCHSAPRS